MSWYPRISTGKLNYYRGLPKVDLHRHLEGSLRLETIMDVARANEITISSSFHALVRIQPSDPLTFNNFLSKFQHLRQIYRSPEVIKRVTEEAIQDAAADGLLYLELRFTPLAMARLQGYSLGEVMDWVTVAAWQASQKHNIPVRLIASLNRHESVEIAEKVARLACERMSLGVVGLDLAGNEAEFSAAPFAGVFREARESGLRITVHAGEWGGAENVRQAIEELGAERVGHGVRAIEDPAVIDLARERGTVLEVCVTSNYQSGVVKALSDHPLEQLIEAGLVVTINSDDPGISGITLTDEYRLTVEELGLPPEELLRCVQAAARAAFLPAEECAALEAQVKGLWDSVGELP
jgi:adenosine deaminase